MLSILLAAKLTQLMALVVQPPLIFGTILLGINFNMKNQRGFTFIELILYVAIVTIILSAIVPFAWSAIETGVKSAVQQEVNANARYISERIKYEIRNSTDINLPVVGSSGTTLSIVASIPATNPTIIDRDLPTGNITIKQGAGSTVNLNSANTVISSLTFTSYTSGDNKTKHIRFNMTVLASFAATRQEYQDSVVIESSAEVRSN